MFCIKCGKKLPEGAAFCLYCGAPVPEMGEDTGTEEREDVGVETSEKPSRKKQVTRGSSVSQDMAVPGNQAEDPNKEKRIKGKQEADRGGREAADKEVVQGGQEAVGKKAGRGGRESSGQGIQEAGQGKKSSSRQVISAGKSGKPPVRQDTSLDPDEEEDIQRKVVGEAVTKNIVHCPDGVYRWIYEFDMLQNPCILLTVWKIFGGICLVGLAAMLLGSLKDFSEETIFDIAKGGFLLTMFLLSLAALSYLIVAAVFGWKYMVLFEMDEEGVTSIQMKQQFKKAQAIGWLTMLVGIASRNPSAIGIGLSSASRSTASSLFRSVRGVRPNKFLRVIYVRSLLFHNQIYAEKEDFDFVLQFIRTHVRQAREKKSES